MARIRNNSSITTDVANVSWAVNTVHNFLITNTNDGPVRITFTPNNDLEFSSRHLGHTSDSVNHHSLNGDSFTLEGDTGVYLRLVASAVDSDAAMNTVTFTSDNLHTNVRNATEPATFRPILIALQSTVQDGLI